MTDSESSIRIRPGLYIVATPIGNLGDITLRSIDILRNCDGVACEDTRVTGKLLHHLGIKQRLLRYDDHASEQARGRLLDMMETGAIALVSDAGTPLISDPGYRLVKEARSRNIPVTSLPGPCAAITGLTMSGLPNDRFLFAGFIPAKDKARADFLSGLATLDATLIFYETGPRLARTLGAMAQIYGSRELAVARELTKMHEECRTGTATELLEYYSAHEPRGEIVLLAGPPAATQFSGEDADALLVTALKTAKPSQAASEIARKTGLDRKMLYARALELRGS
ncbi:MAG: 16S rRNA (cytidine(1402)-2'-O)-methyltransferase [Sphingomonadaceae bacterium]